MLMNHYGARCKHHTPPGTVPLTGLFHSFRSFFIFIPGNQLPFNAKRLWCIFVYIETFNCVVLCPMVVSQCDYVRSCTRPFCFPSHGSLLPMGYVVWEGVSPCAPQKAYGSGGVVAKGPLAFTVAWLVQTICDVTKYGCKHSSVKRSLYREWLGNVGSITEQSDVWNVV